MARPDDLPSFATDANFTNGPDAGTATKIEPSAGELAEGHIRGTAPSAQKENWWKNLVGEWFGFYANEYPQIDIYEGPTSATWTKPTWAKTVQVLCVGAGGGGGGVTGATDASGCGGGGGEVVDRTVPASFLPSTLAVIAGGPGLGGTAGGAPWHGTGTTGENSSVSGATYGTFSIEAYGGEPGGTFNLGGDGGGAGGGEGATNTSVQHGSYGGGGGGGRGASGFGVSGGRGYAGGGGRPGGAGSFASTPTGWGGGGAGGAGGATFAGGGGGGALGVGPTAVDGSTGSGNAGQPGVVIFISW